MAKKPIDKQEPDTTGHEWDGIQEYNNPLPRWWVWVFYATIVWGLWYVIAYPAWPLINQATAGYKGWSTRANVAATASSTSPSSIRSLANNLRWSAQLSASHSVLCWFTTAKCSDACAKDERTDVPEMATSPLVGSTARMTADMVVVLPAPFAPSSPKTSPVRTPKVHPRTASTAL